MRKQLQRIGLGLLILGGPALFAQEDDVPLAGSEEVIVAPEPSEEEQVTYGGTVLNESVGGATGFQYPQGLYLSTDLGVFSRFGGYSDSGAMACVRCAPVFMSKAQPWLGINLGYDITKSFGFELSLSSGFIGEASAQGYDAAAGETSSLEPSCINSNDCTSPENSNLTMLNLGITGTWFFYDRLALQGKLFGGVALMTADPNGNQANWLLPDDVNADLGFSFGLGFGLRYATLLPNVIIGLDVNLVGVYSQALSTRHLFGAKVSDTGLPLLPALSAGPVIKYVF